MQNREYIVFEQTRDTESTSHVHVCESCAHYIFNQLAGGYSFASKEIVVEFACWNNAVKFIASSKQNNSEGFIGSPQILFSFKKRPNIKLYVEYLRT